MTRTSSPGSRSLTSDWANLDGGSGIGLSGGLANAGIQEQEVSN